MTYTTLTSKPFLQAVADRRTIYALSKESTIADERIQDIISEAVKHTPSAFNSQSTRIVLLLGKQHDKLWELTTEVLRAIVSPDKFASTEQKMAGFQAAYGTVLFFEDQSVIESYQAQFPSYQEKFPEWSQQTNAMHQYVVWTALEAEGLGANLQHYNPLIDDKVKAEWSLPETWKLIAQMPFGKPTGAPGEKEYKPVEERLKVFS